MEQEHEEAMRRDYAEMIGMRHRAWHSDTPLDAEHALYDRMRVIKNRWLSGPYQQHWEYLESVHRQLCFSPERVGELTENTQLTEVEQRSVKQVHDLVTADTNPIRPPRQRPRRER